MNAKPGFSKSDGYALDLYLNKDGSQTIVFEGPMLHEPLIINNTSLNSLLKSETSLVTATPDINKLMLGLLTSINIFNAKDILEDYFDVVVIHGSDGGKTSSPVWAMTLKEGLTETFKWGELKKRL